MSLLLAMGIAGCSGRTETETKGGETIDLPAFASVHPNAKISTATPGPEGDLWLGGSILGAVDFGNAVSLTATSGLFLAHLASDGKGLWAATTGSAVPPTALARRADGGIVVVGNFASAIDLGGGLIQGSQDGYVGAFSAAGAPLFSGPLGGFDYDEMADVATAKSDGSFVASIFLSGNVDLGAGTPTPPIDGFQHAVIAFDAEGKLRWDERIDDAGVDGVEEPTYDIHPSVSVAPDGAVYFSGSSDLGATVGGQSVPAGGYVGKLDSAGNLLWLVPSNAPFARVRVLSDSKGDVVIGGVRGPGASLFGQTVPTTTYEDSFLAKLDADGKPIFVKHIGAGGNVFDFTISLGADDAITVGQASSGRVTFGGETFEHMTPGGPVLWDMCVAKLSGSGAHVKSNCWPASEMSYFSLALVSIDAGGDALIAGNLVGSLKMGDTSLESADYAAFVTRVPF